MLLGRFFFFDLGLLAQVLGALARFRAFQDASERFWAFLGASERSWALLNASGNSGMFLSVLGPANNVWKVTI